MIARSRSKSSAFGACKMSSTICAVISLPMVGVMSSKSKAASRLPLFFRGSLFLLFVVLPSLLGGGYESTGIVALGAMIDLRV